MILGTISAVDADNGLQLIIDGEDLPTTKKYTYMASYVPSANDRVLVEEISGSYVIIGKMVSEYASSGLARQADTATTASTATSATNADHATSADSATNANYATSAGTAATISGVYTMTGGLVTNFTQQYDASIGSMVVTGITLSNNNYLYK